MNKSTDSKGAIVITVFGMVIVVIVLFIYNSLQIDEYKLLTNKDSLNNVIYWQYSDREGSHVIFTTGEKYLIPWAQNRNYPINDLRELLSSGDRIVKRSLSDTVEVTHSDEVYIYVLEKLIEKNK